MTYRSDIDGLRAVAVLAVIGFHAFPEWVRGGFVGVDVFFVISGYLISGIIFEGLRTGRFTFTGFYARRIKRIFPALVLVLAVCYACGWFLLLGDPFMQLGKHIAAAAGFVSNFAFWNESGYFDNAAETKPLLHLWSLGVEEQFYLIWPLAAYVVWWLRLNLLLLTGLAVATSMFFNLEGIRRDLVGTFYSPVTRFWELMSGSVLACVAADPSSVSRRLHAFHDRLRADAVWRDRTAMAGLVVVLGTVVALDRSRHFPGLWALLPVSGAWLLLAAGPDAWVNRKILGHRVMVWIGLISYPLYLWHWPLLSFARILNAEAPSLGLRIAAVGASVVLAWLTYKVIERPIRFGAGGRLVVPALCVSMAALFAAGYFTYRSEGLIGRAINRTDKASFVQYYDDIRKHGIADAYRRECDFMEWGTDRAREAIDPVCTQSGTRRTALLWGDSFAQALSLGIRSVLPGDTRLAQVATSHCRPSVVPVDLDVPGGRCQRANNYALAAIARLKPELVVLAQIGAHEETDWAGLTARVRALGAKDVVLIGPSPQWAPSLPLVVTSQYWGRSYDRVSYGLNADVLALDRRLATQFRESSLPRYVSLIERLCNAGGCVAAVPGTSPPELVAFDMGHLTPRGSVYVAEIALRSALIAR
ncbi:MAG: acyltransferase family protein [Acidobacteriota bacterium]|nr:acyltransferase family protein [Acidobacteriota bacterium]